MTRICGCGCGASLAGMRADAAYHSEACKKRAERARSRDRAGTERPLSDVNAHSKLNERFRPLVRQAIIDRLRTGTECHADDLIDLYPEGHVSRCKNLATALLGSMARQELIRKTEWRKSSEPGRNGGGSWVWVFTKAGWDKYGIAGLGAGPSLGGSASVESGESRVEVPHDRGCPGCSTKQDPLSPVAPLPATPPKPNPSSSDTSSSEGNEVRLFDLDQARERPPSALTDPRAA